MRYFADTEFDGGKILSLGIVREDGESLYQVFPYIYHELSAWVQDNVIPKLFVGACKNTEPLSNVGYSSWGLYQFFKGDNDIEVVVDWPIDIHYIAPLLLRAPDKMIDIPGIRFTVERVESWPSKPYRPEYQHNALYDALALRHRILES